MTERNERTAMISESWAPDAARRDMPEPVIVMTAFQILIADYLATIESNDERTEKMDRNIALLDDRLTTVAGAQDPRQIIHTWATSVSQQKRTRSGNALWR